MNQSDADVEAANADKVPEKGPDLSQESSGKEQSREIPVVSPSPKMHRTSASPITTRRGQRTASLKQQGGPGRVPWGILF